MAIFFETLPIILPRHIIFTKPVVSLEHTLCKNNIYILDIMINTPNVSYYFFTAGLKKILKVNLVKHTLDKRHSYLEGMMHMLSAESIINYLCILFGNQALAVKTFNFHIGNSFHAFVFHHRACLFICFYCDNRYIIFSMYWIIYNDNSVGFIYFNAVNSCAV